MIPTQSMDVTLDQNSIIIYATPDIILIMGGVTTPDTIYFFPEFMKIPNYSSRYMAIHAAADLSKSLQTPRPGSTFQVGGSQLKAIRELAEIFYS